jgi:Ni,Fe-hydrogenase III large subunit/Ni,Fe-hydrogenase III component G
MIRENIQQYIPAGADVRWDDNAAVFEVSVADLTKIISDLNNHKHLSLKIITATDEREASGCFKIWYVFGIPKENAFIVAFIRLQDTVEFPSVALIIHEAWNYERKIKDFFGLTPLGHPDLRPLLLHENWPTDMFPLRKDFDGQSRPEDAKGSYAFQKVEGEGIYEIPVGPIHAGIIEPGHFRFSVAGESIVLLEPRLGFVHKGSEKLFETLPLSDKVRLSEKISGDSSLSHSLAFCQALEQLSDTVVPKRALSLRVIYAELERLANHFGDIGAIMIDTGFNFGGANGARLREMVMQINERLTGSRFLRGVNSIGGVTKDIDTVEQKKLSDELERISKDFEEVIAIAENSASLFNRLKGTGVLSPEVAYDRGVMGIAGKACGIRSDARVDYPYAAYEELFTGEIATENSGDVFARFNVRIKEARALIGIIIDALNHLPEGSIVTLDSPNDFKKNALAISIVEGWRGEIVYFVTTDIDGNISRVAPRDPSFINWGVVGDAGFDNVVPDFPLINKSFNMSYSGNDL